MTYESFADKVASLLGVICPCRVGAAVRLLLSRGAPGQPWNCADGRRKTRENATLGHNSIIDCNHLLTTLKKITDYFPVSGWSPVVP